MDSVQFDHLTKFLAARLPRRRAIGLLSGLTLGLGAGSPRREARAGKNNKHKGEVKCQGEWVKRCSGGQVLNFQTCLCECPVGQQYSTTCERCVDFNAICCPGDKQCGQDCYAADECCPGTERKCTKSVKKKGKKKGTKTESSCVTLPECCPGEDQCPIEPVGCCEVGEKCAPFYGCCELNQGRRICDTNWCCTESQKCCPGQGCIPNTQCCDGQSSCASGPRRCCEAGEKCCPGLGCRPTTDACCVLSCPSSPTGCCQQGEKCCTGEGCILDSENCEQTSCPQGTQQCGNGCCAADRTCCLNPDSGNFRCCPVNSICYPGSGDDMPACCAPGSVGCHGDCCTDSAVVKCCDKSNGQTHCFAVGVACPA